MLNILNDLDFTQGEIRVYEALLKIGEATIGPISQASNITPSKVYPILDKLLQKGLIAKIKKEKTLYFTPNDPTRILTYLDEKKNKLEIKKQKVKKILPKLKKMHQVNPPNTRVLQGYGGLQTFYEEHNRMILKKDKIFRAFSFEADWNKEEVKRFIHKQDMIRKELGIKVRIIANKRIKKYIEKKDYKLVDIRFTDQNIPIGTVISGSQVALMSWQEQPLIVVIDSETIAKSYLRFFDEIWRQSKK